MVKAKKYYEKSLKILIKHYGEGHIETAITMTNLGGIYLNLREIVKAQEYINLSL